MLLQNIRDRAQGWFAWVLVLLIAAIFMFWGMSDLFQSGPNTTAATVHGHAVTWHEVDAEYERLMRSQDDPQNLNTQQLKKQALNALIQSRILDQAAGQLGLSVSVDQLISMIQTIPDFQEAGHFSRDRYLKTLSSAFYTEKTFEEELRRGLMMAQLQQSVIQSEFSLSSELSTLIALADQHRDFGYILIPLEPFKKKAIVTPEEITSYYPSHAGVFKSKDELKVQYGTLSLEEMISKVHLTDLDLQQYYEDHLESFSEPEKMHAAHLLIIVPQNADTETLKKAEATLATIEERLKAGDSFESLARSFSNDKATAEQGGDLHWFKRGDMTPEFEQTAFALEKDGQISQPVRTEYGFHLIKRVSYVPSKVRSFKEVSTLVAAALQKEKAMELLLEEADQMAALAFENPDSLEPIAEKLGLKIDKTDWFDKGGASEGLLSQSLFLTSAFSPEVIAEKHNSDLLDFGGEKFVVLRLEAFQPSEPLKLHDVKDDIKNILALEKAKKSVQEEADKLALEFSKNSGLAVAKKENKEWHLIKNASRQALGEDDEIIRYGFSIPRPKAKLPSFGVLELNSGDLAIVQVLAVRDGDIDSLSTEQQKLFRQGLAQSFGELGFTLYATHLFETAKINQ